MEIKDQNKRPNPFHRPRYSVSPQQPQHGAPNPNMQNRAPRPMRNAPPRNLPSGPVGQFHNQPMPVQHQQPVPMLHPHNQNMPVPQSYHEPMAPAQPSADQNAFARVDAEDDLIGHYLKRARLVLLVLVLGVGGWAFFSEISGAVIASGKVVVEANVKSVQHLEGGIVREIFVKDGQKVQQGDVLLRLDKTKVEGQLEGLKAQAKSKEQQLSLLKSELEDLQALASKGLVPKNRIVRTERELAELSGEHGRIQSDIQRFSSDRSRLEVRAPLDGRVHKLAMHTIGGVVTPGQEILQIVPSDAKLILETRINPTDIDQVHPGQAVIVKLPSFNQRTTPELKGEVVTISPDLVKDEQSNMFYYNVNVGLKQGELDRLEGKELVPGMPAEAYIQTQSRTVMSYLLRPLTDQIAKALREE